MIVHVFYPSATTFRELQAEKDAAARFLAEAAVSAAAPFETSNLKIRIKTELIESAEVRASLVSFCKEFDFVVVGSTGNSEVGTFLLGSVAQYVLSHCPVNVIVVR